MGLWPCIDRLRKFIDPFRANFGDRVFEEFRCGSFGKGIVDPGTGERLP